MLRLRSTIRLARPLRVAIPCSPRLMSSLPTSSHNSLTADDLQHFASFLPKSSILSTIAPFDATPDDLQPFNQDWLGKYLGKSKCVLKPRTTEEVSNILKWCYERRIPVVPQGGNTGLVGGGVPVQDEVIISLANMSNVRSFDPVSGVLVSDAGCILENLNSYLAEHEHIMPLDLGAKGSCHIGGNVATNAGGLRLLRYGSLHGSVLGLEVVLPDGSILSELTTLRKDNTGYDLKQLFIGSEGTLGIITGVSILTPPAPKASSNLLLALPSFNNVTGVFKVAKSHLSEILSAFEYIDRQSYNLVSHQYTFVVDVNGHSPSLTSAGVSHTSRQALDESEVGESDAFVLIETSGGKKEHDEEKLQLLLESLYSEGELITTGTLSQSQDQFASLWAVRELIPEAASKAGKVYKYDVSVPVSKFREVTDTLRQRLAGAGIIRGSPNATPGPKVTEVISYGHFGDGNLHLNIIAEAYTPEIEAALEPFIYELVASHRGSISAEHGVGVMKAHALHYSKGDVSREYMKKIKKVFDDRGIMNPGKVIE